MKRIFAFFAVAALFAGCQKDIIDDSPVETTLCAPLTLTVGESTTRMFDDNLVWSWEESDEIVGYQNVGDKTRNTLELKEGNKFHCEAFAYSTEEATDFHFFYANEDSNTKALTAVQDGTWRPVLVGTATATTLGEISTVAMEHLSAALEVRVWKGTKENPIARKVTAAKLWSNSDFVGKWSVDNNLAYTQSLDGSQISLTDLNSSTVVFNMPVNKEEESFAADKLKLTLTVDGVNQGYSLPELKFVAGKRTVVNIVITTMAKLQTIGRIQNNIPDNATLVRFVVNSNETSSKILGDDTYPIYVITKNITDTETEIEFHTPADKIVASEDCWGMFYERTRLKTIEGFSNIDTSNVTNMKDMFWGCSALTSLDLSGFNTSNVTDMSYMFMNCSSLASLDLSSFNTSNVTEMDSIFKGCSNLISITLSENFNTSQVTNMSSMFSLCTKLEQLDLSDFNTSNVFSMMSMFSGCSALTSITFGENFSTSNVLYMKNMFDGCSSLTTLNLSYFNTSNVTNMANMFKNCSELTSLVFGSNFNTSKVTDMSYMFYNCKKIPTPFDLTCFNTSEVTNMSYMFYGLNNLHTLNLSTFTIKNNNVVVDNMFGGVKNGNGITYIKVQQSAYRILSGKTNVLGTDCNYKFTKPEGGYWE